MEDIDWAASHETVSRVMVTKPNITLNTPHESLSQLVFQLGVMLRLTESHAQSNRGSCSVQIILSPCQTQ